MNLMAIMSSLSILLIDVLLIYFELENILIDEDGYPIICDFGFCKCCELVL